jgi:transcriptional regulator with XRE-family HTH domain
VELTKRCPRSAWALVFLQEPKPNNFTASGERVRAHNQRGKLAGIHHAQIGRYENKGAHPSSNVLAKLANTLEVSAEFLLNGGKENLAENTLTDKELLSQFKTVEQMPEEEKSVVKKVVDALITKSRLRQLAV